MKLYTYFRAQEMLLVKAMNELILYGIKTKECHRLERKASNVRDGLIRRMERIEMKNILLEDRILQLLSSEFGDEIK